MNIINTKNIYITINIFFFESGEIFFPFKTIFIIVSLPSSESVIHSPPLEFRNMFLTACTCSERRVGSIVVADEENGSLYHLTHATLSEAESGPCWNSIFFNLQLTLSLKNSNFSPVTLIVHNFFILNPNLTCYIWI
jgi:hypothetical protein